MNKNDFKRLQKLEKKMYKIARDELKLEFCPIEFDIVPPQKMLEIMAYNIPTNISNWKKGRDYERVRTIYEHQNSGLPYEVVLNSNPSRAYFMKNNVFVVQLLVMAHVIGHVAFFTMNRFFQNSRKDIISVMANAQKRFNEYERIYGIDEVEKIIDAGHSIQLHSSPFETETETEKRKRIYDQEKKRFNPKMNKDYSQFFLKDQDLIDKKSIEEYNIQLWKNLKNKTPVEPTKDLLRYIIDNSLVLEDWQKDILEVLRMEGQYYWPIIKTKTMNEGFAVFVHEYIMHRLMQDGDINSYEHSQYNWTNSLVKAKNPVSLNPYLIGSEIFKDIRYRWDTGRHGFDFENIRKRQEREEWNTNANEGLSKIIEVVKTYNDWSFMSEFLTPEMVDKLNLYIYFVNETKDSYDYIRTKHNAKEIGQIIANSFGQSIVPHIEVVDGNYNNKGDLKLVHKRASRGLDEVNSQQTTKHVKTLWNPEKDVYLLEETIK